MSTSSQNLKLAMPLCQASRFLDVAAVTAIKLASAFLLICIIFIGVGSGFAAAAESERTSLRLNILLVEHIDIRDLVVGTGTIEPLKSSDIGALVQGQVADVFVDVGDRVEKGAALFQIRPHTYQFKVDEAKARLAMARARATEAENAFIRTEELYSSNTVSIASLEKARSLIDVAKAEVLAATARLENAEQDLADTVVRAPFRGVVTARGIDEGIYLSTLLSGGTGQSIIQLQEIDIVMAIIRIPSRTLEQVQVNSKVRLDIDGISLPVEANISVINDKVDVATRTIEVRISIPNENYTIKPGLFVRAEIMPEPRSAIVVPRNVILGDLSSPYVFILQDGKVIRRNVRMAEYDASQVEVISGLAAGDHILSGPDIWSLVDGQTLGEVPNVAG